MLSASYETTSRELRAPALLYYLDQVLEIKPAFTSLFSWKRRNADSQETTHCRVRRIGIREGPDPDRHLPIKIQEHVTGFLDARL